MCARALDGSLVRMQWRCYFVCVLGKWLSTNLAVLLRKEEVLCKQSNQMFGGLCVCVCVFDVFLFFLFVCLFVFLSFRFSLVSVVLWSVGKHSDWRFIETS